MARGKYKRKRQHQAQWQVSIDTLGFSTRLQKLLESNGILTLGSLMEKTDDELLNIKGIGAVTIAEINEKRKSIKEA